MGMFDSVYIKVKCPKCGHVAETECQTKDTDCCLSVWRKGDYVDGEMDELFTIANCINCDHYFHPRIKLSGGCVTEDYEI